MPRAGRSENFVLDAGPLFTYLLLHYLDRTGVSKARRDALFREHRSNDPAPFAETEQDAFRQLLKAHRALTTAYVITEVFRLRERSSLKQVQEQFRRFGLELFADGSVQEAPCSLREMRAQLGFDELICRLGPADASVVYLAHSRNCLALTDDRRMMHALEAGTRSKVRMLSEYLNTTP